MTPGQTCSSCAAYSPLTNECRRKSPTALPIKVGDRTAALGLYPATAKDSWCAEWLEERVLQ